MYSSATRPTITKALAKLLGSLGNYLEQRQRQRRHGKDEAEGSAADATAAAAAVDEEGFPAALPPCLFEVVMARDHCQPAPKVGAIVSLSHRVAS